jgi:predicted RNase H-like HicB family nuclease
MDISILKNAVWKEDEHYVAQSLNVDVSSFGDSKQSAITNLREALELYFEDVKDAPYQSVQEPEILSV